MPGGAKRLHNKIPPVQVPLPPLQNGECPPNRPAHISRNSRKLFGILDTKWLKHLLQNSYHNTYELIFVQIAATHDLIFQTQYSESHLRIFEFIFRSRQTQSINFQTKEQGSHLRIFTVKKEFLGRLVLHLLAPLVARNVPKYFIN